jgi:hypothetical protein
MRSIFDKIHFRFHIISLTSILTLLSACQTQEYLQNTINSSPLLPPTELGSNKQTSQLVTLHPKTTHIIEKPNRPTSFSFISAWSVNMQEFTFVALTSTGQRLMSLRYNGNQLQEDYSPLLKAPISGHDILFHLQLAHWPIESIHKHFTNTPWKLHHTHNKRSIYFQRHHIVDIVKSPSTDSGNKMDIIIINYPMQYRLDN